MIDGRIRREVRVNGTKSLLGWRVLCEERKEESLVKVISRGMDIKSVLHTLINEKVFCSKPSQSFLTSKTTSHYN